MLIRQFVSVRLATGQLAAACCWVCGWTWGALHCCVGKSGTWGSRARFVRILLRSGSRVQLCRFGGSAIWLAATWLGGRGSARFWPGWVGRGGIWRLFVSMTGACQALSLLHSQGELGLQLCFRLIPSPNVN